MIGNHFVPTELSVQLDWEQEITKRCINFTHIAMNLKEIFFLLSDLRNEIICPLEPIKVLQVLSRFSLSFLSLSNWNHSFLFNDGN